MSEPWHATLSWCTDHIAFVDTPAPRDGVKVIEIDAVAAVVKQLREALDYARQQEASGRHDWCDDEPVLTALKAAWSLHALTVGSNSANSPSQDLKEAR
jgi:hypothetical protein